MTLLDGKIEQLMYCLLREGHRIVARGTGQVYLVGLVRGGMHVSNVEKQRPLQQQ